MNIKILVLFLIVIFCISSTKIETRIDKSDDNLKSYDSANTIELRDISRISIIDTSNFKNRQSNQIVYTQYTTKLNNINIKDTYNTNFFFHVKELYMLHLYRTLINKNKLITSIINKVKREIDLINTIYILFVTWLFPFIILFHCYKLIKSIFFLLLFISTFFMTSNPILHYSISKLKKLEGILHE